MTPTDFIQRFDLAGKTCVETGCLEGKHTVQLLNGGCNVIAVDVKQENIDATRKYLAGVTRAIHRDVVLIKEDLETWTFPDVAACWHSGTLYHLTKPVEHLHRNLPKIRHALYLSTHYSPNNKPHWHRETQGMPKAGLSNRSLWLPEEDIIDIVQCEFGHVEKIDRRIERHGPRIELVAWR